MKKLLRHFKFAPIALLLAFLAAGAPNAPAGNWLPGSGIALATPDPDPLGGPLRRPYVDPMCDPTMPGGVRGGPTCYLTGVPAVIAWVVTVVAGTLGIADSCRFGTCRDIFDGFIDWLRGRNPIRRGWGDEDWERWLDEHEEEARREAEEYRRDWCNRATRGQRAQMGC